MGCDVYGFEPDAANYAVARKVGAENNFVAENFALGSYKHAATFTHHENPGASRIDPDGVETVQIVTLDSYVRTEKNLDMMGLRPVLTGFGECVLFAR